MQAQKQIESDTRLMQIERGINREMANQLPISRSSGGTFTIAPQSMGELLEFSKLMAVSDFCVRPAFRGNPGACLAVALQAFRCGGDPFAWCNKAYLVKNKAGEEQISYEAQLVHAVVNSSGILQRRLRPVYEGEGTKRKCRIIGYIKGESEPFEYESPMVEEITIKNSPLWHSDRDQQLFYYSTRGWARRHCPEILLGIYVPEEMGEILDMTPEDEPQREDYVDVSSAAPEPEPAYEVVALDGEVFTFETLDGAVEATRTVLESARRGGPKMLDAALENNEALIAEAARHGADLVAEFRPESAAPSTPAARTEVPAPSPPEPAPTPAEPPTAPPSAATVPPAPPTPPPPEARPAPAPPPPEREEDYGVFPGDLPPGQSLFPPASVSQPPPIEERLVEEPPPRQSRTIEPTLKRGSIDWQTWARALMVPKVRQQKTSNDLAFLLGDNEAHLQAARANLPASEIGELDRAIDEAWKRLR